MSVGASHHLIEFEFDLSDGEASVRIQYRLPRDLSDMPVSGLISHEFSDIVDYVANLLHLPVGLLHPYLPRDEDAGERAQVRLLAACPLVGEEQLVGAVGELEIHV